MFGMILSWLTGGGIAAIGKQLNEAYQAKLTATTNEQKLEAEIKISQLQARQEAIVNSRGNFWYWGMIAGFALPFIIYNAKLVIWDKVLALGVTDPLSAQLWEVESKIIGFLVLSVTAAHVLRK